MKSLVILSYVQPVEGSKIRVGVVEESRDTVKYPVAFSYYRMWEEAFQRSKTLLTCRTLSGFRQFYAERTNWKIKIPFLGSLVSPYFKWFGKE